jgi:lysylphosphatidylglycerol synthetase-like protein (DUF2156 family)
VNSPVTIDPNVQHDNALVEPSALPDWLLNHGQHSLAYSTLQTGLKHYTLPGVGAIAYRKCMGHTIVLGNPICAYTDTRHLVESFMKTRNRVIFAQIDTQCAMLLESLGLFTTPAGADTAVHLSDFTLNGHAKRDLRRARNSAARAGIEIAEVQDSRAERFQICQLSKRWLQRKRVSRRELSFLVRPLATDVERGVRIFTAIEGSRLIGTVIFDPMYKAGRCIGYVASTLRADADAPSGTLDSIVLKAIDTFRAEGIRFLSLGVMPLHRIQKRTDNLAYPLWLALRTLAALPRSPLVNARGLCFHKSRYRPEEVPVYIATTSPVGLIPMAILTRVCGILP